MIWVKNNHLYEKLNTKSQKNFYKIKVKNYKILFFIMIIL